MGRVDMVKKSCYFSDGLFIRVDIYQFLLLGAVPFRKDVRRLKRLGVDGVITLNEPYETLVSSSLYRDYKIDHLVIPTRDYLYSPSLADIDRAVDLFIEMHLVAEKLMSTAKLGEEGAQQLCFAIW